jgi:hypothetical protein
MKEVVAVLSAYWHSSGSVAECNAWSKSRDSVETPSVEAGRKSSIPGVPRLAAASDGRVAGASGLKKISGPLEGAG